MEEPARLAVEAPRPPLGLRLLGLVYVVLGAHAVLIAGYLLTLAPDAAPSLALGDFLAAHPGFVRGYAFALLGIGAAFFANGALLGRGWRQARWTTLVIAWLHIVGPPFLLGGVVLALAVNVYLFGSRAAWAFYHPAPAAGASEA